MSLGARGGEGQRDAVLLGDLHGDCTFRAGGEDRPVRIVLELRLQRDGHDAGVLAILLDLIDGGLADRLGVVHTGDFVRCEDDSDLAPGAVQGVGNNPGSILGFHHRELGSVSLLGLPNL